MPPTVQENRAREWWRAMDRRQAEIIAELFTRIEKLEGDVAYLLDMQDANQGKTPYRMAARIARVKQIEEQEEKE